MTSRPTWSRWVPFIGGTVAFLALVGIGASVLTTWFFIRSHETTILIDDPVQSANVVISIAGAVATPGLYELPGGSRVQHVLDAAGGVLPGADLAAVNPAVRLQDGERIVIPIAADSAEGEEAVAMAATAPAETMAIATSDPAPTRELSSTVGSGKIDINTADQDELEQLPGIGPAKASAVIAYRDEHGPFASIEELERVEGISEEMVVDLSPYIFAGT